MYTSLCNFLGISYIWNDKIMSAQHDQVSYNVRTYLTPKLAKHKKLRRISAYLYGNYCQIAGPLHVLPDFYIIGGQKCGTTSLFEYLSLHPTIQRGAAKDIRFFDKYYFKGTNWYKLYFPLKIKKSYLNFFSKKKFLTGDATERYLEHPFAPQRIKNVTPHAKFLVLLRNPIDRAFSHYTMNVVRKMESLPFEKAIEIENERIKNSMKKMKTDNSYYDDTYFRYAYLDRGTYITKLKQWFEIFPKNQFLIIQSEKFWLKPSKVYNEVLKFLGLSNFKLNEYKQFRKTIYRNKKIPFETRKKLIDFFRPYNEQLYEFLGRRFDWDK